jgi:DNA polymerase-1
MPLLKDVFKEERRKAKILNFSIAYGKTVHGLAQDWGISKEEAEETLQAWYSDRPEVKKWQDSTRKQAKTRGFVRTLMGRYRMLPDARLPNGPAQGHALRAAINTPIQGSAADIVMCAMLRIRDDATLARLGFRQVMQIHDDVVLEGPEEHADEALPALVRAPALRAAHSARVGFALSPAEALLAVLDAFEKPTTVNTALTKLKKAHLDADSAREVIDHLTMGRFLQPA